MSQLHTCMLLASSGDRAGMLLNTTYVVADLGIEPRTFFFKDFIYLFIERGEGKEKEERNISVWLPLMRPLLGTWPHNPGTCPDWESNPRPSGSQASAQSTESHQPGLSYFFSAY